LNNEKLIKILRKEGLRFTKQRKAIWDEVKTNSDHLDAEDLFYNIKSKGVEISRATVYRTIDMLARNNLVRKMDVGDGRYRYELRKEDEHHDHMICLETGDIIEFFNQELEELQEKIARDHGYAVVRHIHQLFVKPIK